MDLKKIVLILLVIFLVGCQTQPSVTFFTDDGQINILVEVAQTREQQAQGLMFRESLGENKGMLFVFEDETPRTFWMKNTLIPLDIIFLNSELTVTEVKSDVQPCTADPCPLYPGEKPTQYIVEVNAGFADMHGIDIGTRMTTTIS